MWDFFTKEVDFIVFEHIYHRYLAFLLIVELNHEKIVMYDRIKLTIFDKQL